MTRLLLILALLATVFWVYSIVDCAVQPATRHRGVSKPVWIVLVIVLPVLGGILWFVIGRPRRSAAPARRAPDDDPEFLGRIGSISDQDERIRRLEEELALLDSEGEDPRTAPPAAAPGSAAPGSAVPGTVVPGTAVPGSAVPGSSASSSAAPGTPAPERPADRPADGDDDARGSRAVGDL